jgi:hypothetical protein
MSTVVNRGSGGSTLVTPGPTTRPNTKEKLMNVNTTHRIAAAVAGVSIALGVTACGSASGRTSDAPEAPAVAQNVGSEPKSDNEPSQQCYPLEGRHAEIELYYAHADGLDAHPTTACFVR